MSPGYSRGMGGRGRLGVAIWRAAIPFALCLAAALPATQGRQEPLVPISQPETIKAEFTDVPCKYNERMNAARALFEKLGAPASDISVEKFKGVENLVVRKQGATDEKVVIGAHYDFVQSGCGALDNWTGIVTIAYIYASLKDVRLDKTLLFVAFGKEENGLVGSRAMVAAIGKEEAPRYCAMVNIDSLGLSLPQVADNMSSPKLEKLAAEIAKTMKLPFGHASIPNADADSSSFISRKIPALTIHGLSNEWPHILHSSRDQARLINATSVYFGYRLALALVARVAQSPCDAYR